MYNTNFDGSEKIRRRKKKIVMEMREKEEEKVGYFFK